MKRKGRARRNPFPSDPSIPEAPDGEWVMSPRYREFTGGREQFGDFVVTELPDRSYRIQFSAEWISVWRSYGWTKPMQAGIVLAAGDQMFAETSLSESWYLKRVGDVLRVYRIFERKREELAGKVRANPLVADPSMASPPDVELEVSRLVTEYKGDPSGEIETYTDFELQTTRGGLYSFWFTSDLGYWFYWDETYLKWSRNSVIWLSLGPDEHLFVYVPHSNSPDAFYLLQRVGDTLRVYALRVVD